MKRTLLLAPLLAAGLANGQMNGQTSGQTSGQTGEPPMGDAGDVQMLLVLAQPPAHGRVLLRAEFDNRGKRPVLLPRAVAAQDRLLGNVFTVKDVLTGAPVPYVGPMVKRGPLTAADYIVLKPGRRHAHVIDIGPAYGFGPGAHAYEVSYAGHYVVDARALAGDGAPGLPLVAPPVTFRFPD